MENYKKVNQWASTLNSDKAKLEIDALILKYPWLKCAESLAFITKMQADLPKIMNIIKHQEKQNAIMRKVIEVNKYADEAIISALLKQQGYES